MLVVRAGCVCVWRRCGRVACVRGCAVLGVVVWLVSGVCGFWGWGRVQCLPQMVEVPVIR